MSEKIIGIDLGTTNSCVAYAESDGTFKVIPNSLGANTTPSVIAFDNDGKFVAGTVAKRKNLSSGNVVYEAKRLIGRRFDELGDLVKNLSYHVVKSDNGDAWVECNGKKYSPSQIASFVLSVLKQDAEAYLGHSVKKAVITVPAYFNDAQRQATKDAGAIAGLEVVRIINEPTAAALAYGLEKNKSGKIAVYDLGGGTFDVSILEIADGVFEVLATNGDTMLGGGNFDEKIIKHLVSEFEKQNGMTLDLTKDKIILQRLKEAAEKAKIELSNVLESEISLPFLTSDASGPKHLNTTLTRAKLEEMCRDLILQTIEPCKKALKDAGLNASELSDIVMVGGMTRMPKIIDEVRKFFGKEPHRGVNPDEVVAVGAAIQGGILKGDVKNVVLLDVTPLTLGIETQGGVLTPLIERNTTIPVKKSQVFSTAEDNQPAVEIQIYQGERPIARDNKLLGSFVLDGIPPARRGVPQIEVIFDMDSNGILHVSAKDKGTGKEHSIRIASSGGLSKEEIERMMNEAQMHAEEDKKRKDLIEKKNQAESLVNTVEKGLEEHGSKLSEDERNTIQESLNKVKGLKDETDPSVYSAAIDDLSKASMKLGEIIYKQEQENQGNSGGPEKSTGSDDNVVDV